MKARLSLFGLCGVIALCLTSLRAEVALEVIQGRPRVLLLMSITDGADPVGLRWEAVRARSSGSVLNPRGDTRVDGYPQLDWDPWSVPSVVWAYTNGTQHDVAFSRGIDGDWSAIEYLSSGPEDDLDPRIFCAQDGVLDVAYWVDGSEPQVILLRSLPRAAGDVSPTWLAPVRVSPAGEAARRPTVAVFGGSVHVAYERGPGEVVVRREEQDGSFSVEQVFPSQAPADLSPVLHVDGGQVWLDWKYSASQLASSRFQAGAWGPIQAYACTDSSWVGLEGLRKSIGSRVAPAVLVAPGAVDGSGTSP